MCNSLLQNPKTSTKNFLFWIKLGMKKKDHAISSQSQPANRSEAAEILGLKCLSFRALLASKVGLTPLDAS